MNTNKSTRRKITSTWKKVKILDYPRHGNGSSFFVQKYLNWEYSTQLSAKQSTLFYALDRFDDSFSVKDEKDDFDIIISNRYVSANMIHQWGRIQNTEEREAFLNWVYDMEYNILDLLKPDLTFFLDISPEKSQELILKKEHRPYIKDWKKMDIHEADINHLSSARKTGLYCAKKYWWEIIPIEKNGKLRDIEEINTEILQKILW